MLRIGLLGELEVTRGGQRLLLPPSRKTRALLAYLIATGRSHRRERLCTLFWEIPDDPRGALRWSLSRLRSILDEPEITRILATREAITFDSGGAIVDLAQLRTMLAADLETLSTTQIASVAALFRGEFLEGLDLPNLHEFHSWCLAEREDLRTLQVKTLSLLTSRLTDQPAAALAHARQWTHIDPFSEAARSALLRILLALGRRGEAEQQFDTAVRLFQELGPGSEQALLRAWKTLTRTAGPPRATEPNKITSAPEPTSAVENVTFADTGIGPLSMVGRTSELAQLAGLMQRSQRHGELSVALIMGEPGLGKSRLVAEIIDVARKTGLRHHIGRAYETDVHYPYRPWIEALEPVWPVLRGIDERDSALRDEVHERERLFQSVIDGLLPTLQNGLVLLAFEDVHWWDEASTELFNFVGRAVRRRPITIVLTAREGELPDNPSLLRVLRILRQENLLTEIRLKPLPPYEVEKLVRSVTLENDPARIVGESGGNPLFALELIRNWRESPSDIPRTVKDMVRDRMERLPERVADVLRWASVLGPTFSSRQLMPLSSLTLDDLIGAFGLLERHGFLRASEALETDGAYEFAHNLVRNAIYTSLSEPRRRLMHLKIARALEGISDGLKSHAAEIAHHAASAGEPGMAAAACVAAGRHCLRVFANVEAESLARRGQRYAEKLGSEERVQRRIELVQIEISARRPLDLAATMQMIEKLANDALDLGSIEHARLGFQTLAYLRWEGGLWAGAQRDMLRAEVLSRSANDRERVAAMGEAARCLALLERDLSQAESLMLEASALARRQNFESSAVLDACGMLRCHQGQFDEAESHFQRAREVARRDGLRESEFLALEHWATMELQRRRYPEAAILCADLRHLAERLREGSEAPFARALEAACGKIEGQPDASSRLERTLSELRTADAKQRLAVALLISAEAVLDQGDLDGAKTWASEAVRLAEFIQRPSEAVHARALLMRIAARTNDTDALKDGGNVLASATRSTVSWLAKRQVELALAELPTPSSSRTVQIA